MSFRFVSMLLLFQFLYSVGASAQENAALVPQSVGVSQTPVDRSTNFGGFGVTYFLIGGQTLINNNTQLSSPDIFDSYLSFNYKVNKDLRFAVRPAFGYSVSGLDNKGRDVTDKSRVRDLSLLITFLNVAEDRLPENMSWKFQPRLYLPTSDGSQEQGMIARLRLENELRTELSRDFELRTYLVPSYFFQRYKAVPDVKGRARTTSMADSEHGIELGYTINKTFAVLPCLHFIEKWSNESPVNNQEQFHSSVLDYRLGLEVNVTRQFGFVFGLQAEKDLIDSKKDMEYSYSILTGGTLF